MSIVFGWNHFKIKSYDPFELGLTTNTNTDFTVEVRQSYFHLFWIPFFGIGKKWAIRKGKDLYELPGAYRDHIRQTAPKVRTPWYTYAGPLLIATIGLGFVISEKMEQQRSREYSKKRFEENVAELTARYKSPTTWDYYAFKGVSDYKGRYGRVIGVSDQAIKLQFFDNDMTINASEPADFVRLFAGLERDDTTNVVSISRNQPDVYICSDYAKADGCKGFPLDGGSYRLEKIYRVEGPILIDKKTGGVTDKGVVVTNVINLGTKAIVKSIEPVSGAVIWDGSQLPMVIETGKTVSIKGQLPNEPLKRYVVRLVYEDSLRKEGSMMIMGTGNIKSKTSDEYQE
jgi:hypothetical protein